MSLIKCPECGKEISDKALACIHCGYPLNNDTAKLDVNLKTESIQNIVTLAPMRVFSVDKEKSKVNIECGNRGKVYMYDEKVFNISKDSYIAKEAIICPNCKNGVNVGAKIYTNQFKDDLHIVNNTNSNSNGLHLNRMRVISSATDRVNIECCKCGKVHTYSNKLFEHYNNYVITKDNIVCPNCKNKANTNEKIYGNTYISHQEGKNNSSGCLIWVLLLFIAFVLLLGKCSSGYSSHDNYKSSYENSVTCSICNKTYSNSGNNARSIAMKGMCISCFENFKYTMDAQGKNLDGSPKD